MVDTCPCWPSPDASLHAEPHDGAMGLSQVYWLLFSHIRRRGINWKQPPDGCEKVPVLTRTIQTAKRCWRTWCWEWQRGSISTPWGLCSPVGEVSLEGRRVSRVGTRSYFDWQMSRWWWWMVMMFPVHRKQTCPTKKIFWIWFIWGYALY